MMQPERRMHMPSVRHRIIMVVAVTATAANCIAASKHADYRSAICRLV